MTLSKDGVDYRLVEYNRWTVGINTDREYQVHRPHISRYDATLWTRKYVLRLL